MRGCKSRHLIDASLREDQRLLIPPGNQMGKGNTVQHLNHFGIARAKPDRALEMRDRLVRLDAGIALHPAKTIGAFLLATDVGLRMSPRVQKKFPFIPRLQDSAWWALLHKLREAMAEEMRGRVVGGEGKVAEVDGGYFGGYVKPANQKEYRRDRRYTRNQNGTFIRARIAKGTVVHADEAGSWDGLHDRFEMKRINHQEAYSLDGACTNYAEEYFSRLRRAEIGIHHHIAGAYLLRYAQESSWREDNRRVSNGDQVSRVAALAMKRGKSVDFTGYWQRHIEA